MKIEITNSQRIKRINLKELKTFLKKIFSLLNISQKRISILFCDNKEIKKLNKKFFNKAQATDVIAFSLQDEFEKDYLGEVIVSVEQAVKISAEYGNTWKKELLLYLVHGILHLLGYDDIKKADRLKMEKKQQQILNKIYG